MRHRVLVIGGGFGGIKTALKLAGHRGIQVTLISDKPHFEYHAALYRVVTGRSPLEVCIPLREIFLGKDVEIIEDKLVSVDFESQLARGKSGNNYRYDSLVLALGSETAYFDIPGLEKLSYGFKSITEALELKNHLHQLMTNLAKEPGSQVANNCHITVVGGGASGVEVAGELITYVHGLAHKHRVNRSKITVDLIESAARLLPGLSEKTSRLVEKRLRHLGVNIYLNRTLIKEEVELIYLKGMEIKTKTVIWTAGVKTNHAYQKFDEFEFDDKGRVVVDEHLHASGRENVYVIGDAAATKFSGMAQTAVNDGDLVAENIVSQIRNRPLLTYRPRPPLYAIPIGPGWAVATVFGTQISGRLGWLVRRAADLQFFTTILPFKKAWLVFLKGRTISENCPICAGR